MPGAMTPDFSYRALKEGVVGGMMWRRFAVGEVLVRHIFWVEGEVSVKPEKWVMEGVAVKAEMRASLV